MFDVILIHTFTKVLLTPNELSKKTHSGTANSIIAAGGAPKGVAKPAAPVKSEMQKNLEKFKIIARHGTVASVFALGCLVFYIISSFPAFNFWVNLFAVIDAVFLNAAMVALFFMKVRLESGKVEERKNRENTKKSVMTA